MSQEKLLTLAQVADHLGCSVRTLQRIRAAGEIGFVTVGTGQVQPRIRFTQEHVEDYLLRAEQRARALPAARRPRRS